MTEEHDSALPATGAGIPEPLVRRRRRGRLSLIWLVPILAALVALSLVVAAWLSAGPRITISFQDAQGLTAGKTEVKYKNVVIGKVHDIRLSADHEHVLVQVNLDSKAAGFATEGSRFWVVRPRIGLGGVSGLGTLLSGAYIGADTSGSGKSRTRFTGLEMPPPLTHNESGRSFTLSSHDLGSLDIGSPVYYRHIQVGRVVSYRLDDDGQGVTIRVFVKAPMDRFVTAGTRFWNASGVDISLGANGLKVNTESLATVITGGVAFGAPEHAGPATPALADSRFKLFHDRASAMQPPDGPPTRLKLRFHQSVRGLTVGAPVDFQGINLGKVTRISLDFDPKTKHFPVDVTAEVYPQRIGKANQRFMQRNDNARPGALLGVLVKHGLRAQLRNANLLTGQLYVALDFFPDAPKASYDEKLNPLEVPTMPGSFDKLQQQVADIVNKIHAMPFDSIGRHADQDLRQIHALLEQLNGQLLPQAHDTLKKAGQTFDHADRVLDGDSPLRQDLGQTLQQLQRAARSLRGLSDYLSRHPQALLWGRDKDAPPTPPSAGTENPP